MSKARSCHCSQHFLLGTAYRLLSLMLVLVLAVPYLAIAQNPTNSDQADSDSKPTKSPWLALDYTGSLFGYYRIEPDEKLQLKPPRRFLEEKRNRANRLLLGMGDNFSPEFGASVQRELEEYKNHGESEPRKKEPCFLPVPPSEKPKPGHKNEAPEVLYKDSSRLPNMAECDNVARFLMQAGYRVIVPGREDFIYSAVWLRRIALSLQAASGLVKNDPHFPEESDQERTVKHDFSTGNTPIKNKDGALLMLAANLRWNFTARGNIQGLDGSIKGVDSLSWFPKDKFSEKVQKVCPLMFSWDPPRQTSETCVPGGDQGNTVTTEMDWMRRLDVTVKADPHCEFKGDDDPEHCFLLTKSMNVRARSDITFRRQLLENAAMIAAVTLSDEIEKIGKGLRSELKAALDELSEHKAFDDLTGNEPQLKVKAGKLAKLDALIRKVPTGDLNLVLCALHDNLKNASKNDVDFTFPLKARKAAIRLLLRKIAAEQKDVGYTIVNSGPMAKTLVIGVIGQDTMKAVSPGNLRVCTRLEGERGIDGACGGKSGARLEGTVVVGDPVLAVTTVLRAAWLQWHDSTEHSFDKVVVMAQMPRTQAEELAAHAATSLNGTACSANEDTPSVGEAACSKEVAEKVPHIDLILGEALAAHTTPKLTLTYHEDELIPVISPKPAWFINQQGDDLIDPVSTVTIACGEPKNSVDPKNCVARTMDNCPPPGDRIEPEGLLTMAQLLHKELQRVAPLHPSADLTNLENFWNACLDQKACEDSVVTQYLLEQVHRSSHADIVFLQFRDFYYGPMLGGYETDYICDEWVKKNENDLTNQQESKAYCRLRVALDRILWKGDYSEHVMVNGKTLNQMLTIAQQETESEQALSARDTVEEWLTTFGIVTHPPENLSAASMGPQTFFIPGATFCKEDPGGNAEASKYCINGHRLADDGAYYVATSDHLAQDKQVYGILQSLDPTYHKKLNLFITREIADELFRRDRDEASEKLVKATNADIGMNKVEELQQKRPILQVDFAKWVAGFMVRSPNQRNTDLAANFSGVTDSRATTPSAQELDLEAITRMTTGALVSKLSQRLKFGIQSDLEYDRAVTGSLTGAPPIVTYALNSFTSGGFVQFRLRGDLVPRLFLVVAPYQYQTQITGNFLNFGLTAATGQITVSAPRSEGFSHRLGLRYEFGGREFPANKSGGHWADSYAEGGPEYSNVNEVLSGLLLPNGSVCPASATVPLTTCVASKIVVTPDTVLIPQTEALHTGGLYWDVHLQFTPNKGKRWSLTLDTKGDDFLWPGATLATQSRYAFTTTEALNFKVIGNLLFTPTYSQFFYRNQGQQGESHSLVTKTFSVVAKWYFARDAAVPFWRQLLFLGPASIDQTKSAKMQ
jgi:hypothetical protein